MQFYFAARALLSGVDDASVEGPRIHVQADRALVEIVGIEDAVNGLERVDGAGVRGIHLNGFAGLEAACSASDVLVHDVKILDQKTADGDSHPAVLIFMVVNGAGLADLPADGEQLVEMGFVDQIAGIVLAVPGEIGRQRIGIERSVSQKLVELLGFVEGGLGEFAQLAYEMLNRMLFCGGGHGLLPEEYNAAGEQN